MSDNEVEAIAGLREAAANTPPPNGSLISDDDETIDPEDMERILMVEQQLLNVYDRQSLLFVDTDKKRIPLRDNEIKPHPIHKPHAYPCADTHKTLPSDPSKWPQAPVMLRPTPNTDTKVRGIRYANSTDYQHFKGFCAGCILPVNTGAEHEGKSLVIDFESKHFVGTLLMRIREAPPADNNDDSQSNFSYFDGKKRKFQAIVKGRFKTPLKMSETITGQVFDRPAGKLPARWIITSFIKFVSTLAPQMQVTLDGDEPRFLTPLVATAHTLLSKPIQDKHDREATIDKNDISKEDEEKLQNYNLYAGSQDIELPVEEPPAKDPTSVMMQTCNPVDNSSKSVAHRQSTRKKTFNHLFAKKAEEPKFDLSKEYTFEFYQHLLLFGETFAVDMGRAMGKVPLAPATNGQPLKFMAAHQPDGGGNDLSYLWSFDIWHSSLYPYAQEAYSME